PLKVIECMAAGLPVVRTRQGDLPEIVGNAGVPVEPGDPQALAVAVRTLLQSPRRRRRLGARARRRAGRHFTWSRTARRLLELAAPLVGARERTA
ncbi:MAG: glycosyltransferase, partial [Planctomycetota bacterium]